MESTSDNLRAFALAVGIHLAVVLALLVGLWWTHETRPVSLPGPVIEAVLVGPTAAPKRRAAVVKPTPAAPKPVEAPPAPTPTPPAPTPPPSEPVKPDTTEQERVAALAQEKADAEKREQDERHRQHQIELQEQERQKQLEEVRKQREVAEKKRRAEQDKLQQIADKRRADQKAAEKARMDQEIAEESDQPRTGNAGQDTGLLAQYQAAIQNLVIQNWLRPDSAQPGLRCTLEIIQIPGGEVISAKVSSPCNADPLTRDSIEQAVRRAAPLPYKGFESVFSRDIKFNFKYDG